ncbi:hypothetical protein CA85_47100 [Allorhodopirellula solitaria]|uniref:Uncharacterized protein n=1 Tax=Allorhodopirellula solitaria TaxID=2527987 RepID=A0A5C5WZ53_9BACT|nr:hypothetical protein CA85_47100 [Allorhodopirellula solitaria]
MTVKRKRRIYLNLTWTTQIETKFGVGGCVQCHFPVVYRLNLHGI